MALDDTFIEVNKASLLILSIEENVVIGVIFIDNNCAICCSGAGLYCNFKIDF